MSSRIPSCMPMYWVQPECLPDWELGPTDERRVDLARFCKLDDKDTLEVVSHCHILELPGGYPSSVEGEQMLRAQLRSARLAYKIVVELYQRLAIHLSRNLSPDVRERGELRLLACMGALRHAQGIIEELVTIKHTRGY